MTLNRPLRYARIMLAGLCVFPRSSMELRGGPRCRVEVQPRVGIAAPDPRSRALDPATRAGGPDLFLKWVPPLPQLSPPTCDSNPHVASSDSWAG